MTRFQALYILYLRHDSMCECSWRSLAANYYNRYNMITGRLKDLDERIKFDKFTFGGNQLDGMDLEEQAFKILIPDPLFMEPMDLFECDLTRIDPSFNLKRHYYDKTKCNGK